MRVYGLFDAGESYWGLPGGCWWWQVATGGSGGWWWCWAWDRRKMEVFSLFFQVNDFRRLIGFTWLIWLGRKVKKNDFF